MLQIAENIKNQWILRVVIIYAVVFWILTKAGIWQASWTIAGFVALSVLIFGFGFVCFQRFSSIEDQNFILARLTYTIGPFYVLFLCGPVFLKVLPGPSIARDIQYFLLMFLGIVWYQISVPFVRSWMRDSPNPEKLLRIERIFSYDGTLASIMDAEPYVPSRTYYAFAAGLVSLVFVFAMALLGNVLGGAIGVSALIGSVSIAFASAAAMYPVHKRVRQYIRVSDTTVSPSMPMDFKLAVAETWRELYDWSRPIVRYWYMAISGMIIIFALIFLYRVVLRFLWM